MTSKNTTLIIENTPIILLNTPQLHPKIPTNPLKITTDVKNTQQSPKTLKTHPLQT